MQKSDYQKLLIGDSGHILFHVKVVNHNDGTDTSQTYFNVSFKSSPTLKAIPKAVLNTHTQLSIDSKSSISTYTITQRSWSVIFYRDNNVMKRFSGTAELSVPLTDSWLVNGTEMNVNHAQCRVRVVDIKGNVDTEMIDVKRAP